MAAPLFTLTAGDGLASRIGVTREALAGARLVLKPNIKDGQLVVIDGGLERVEDVTVVLDADGKINGDTGIQLLADDPSLDLETPLQWQINVKAARTQGFVRSVQSWWIEAGSDGETVDLSTVPSAIGQVATSLSQINAAVAASLPGMVAADLEGRDISFEATTVGGQPAVQPKLGGDDLGDPYLIPSATWESTVGKPLVIAAGSDAESARAAADAARITIIDVRDWNDLSDDGFNSDSAVINAAIAEATGELGGVVQLGSFHALDEPIIVQSLVRAKGRGGHANGTRGTRLLSGALSGEVVRLVDRSSGLSGVRILSTAERRAADVTNGHGVVLGAGDISSGYPSMSRAGMHDVDIRDQPTDGVHSIGTFEMGMLDLITVADCVRHGYVFDGGTISGYSNLQMPAFIATLARCRAFECGGQALIVGSSGGNAPQGIRLIQFEALGCAWDVDKQHTFNSDAASKLFQIQLAGRGHIIETLDCEDQQYGNSTTTTGGRVRDALSVPAKGVYNAAFGVEAGSPFFSSLAQSWYQAPGAAGLVMRWPSIFPGAYSTLQNPAIQIPSTATGVDIRYITAMCTGATTVVQNQSRNARIEANGIPILGLGSSVIPGQNDGIDPVSVTIAADILTTPNRRTIVAGAGGGADDLATIRIASGNSGYQGMDIWLFRGSQDITIKHGTGNILNQSGRDVVMTATANTVLHYVFNGTNWVQVSGPNLPVAAGAYTLTYSTADKTLGAYTPDVENVAYTGSPADAASTAKLADLNALRVSSENTRALAEDSAQLLVALITDLKGQGIIQ